MIETVSCMIVILCLYAWMQGKLNQVCHDELGSWPRPHGSWPRPRGSRPRRVVASQDSPDLISWIRWD